MAQKECAVLMACHNRLEKTLAGLTTLFSQETGSRLQVYLVDDGSTDGTTQAVRLSYPAVRVIAGTGSLYWNRSMRIAFAAALQQRHDYYLWLNDDTLLYPGALRTLLETYTVLAGKGHIRSIVVGSTCDPETGGHTYGGVARKSPWHPMQYEPVVPDLVEARQCDTFNGNCVLIPHAVAVHVGNLDPAFTHGMGDFDYGLRARRLGCLSWVAPGYAGTCRRNPVTNTCLDTTLPLRERWRRVRHPKGLPFREWRVMTQRHAGPVWPLFWAAPYSKMLWEAFVHSFVRGEGPRSA